MGGLKDFFEVFKFSGGAMGDFFKKGKFGGKLSNIVQTDKMRDQMNRVKNVMSAAGGGAILGKALTAAKGIGAGASAVAKSMPAVKAGVSPTIANSSAGLSSSSASASGLNLFGGSSGQTALSASYQGGAYSTAPAWQTGQTGMSMMDKINMGRRLMPQQQQQGQQQQQALPPNFSQNINQAAADAKQRRELETQMYLKILSQRPLYPYSGNNKPLYQYKGNNTGGY